MSRTPSSRVPKNPIEAAGTPEEVWAGWPAPQTFPELDVSGWKRVLVVAAHPDDEVLGLGGLIARLAARGTALRLAAVTDGEASHPGSTAPLAQRLPAVRREEARRALACLGAADAEIVLHLGFPDTAVAQHETALAARLGELMAGCDVCLAPFIGDVHADHEAAGRAAAAAGALLDVPVLHFPVWMWHWARPDDARVPWDRALRVSLDADAQRYKRAAVDCFTSQIQPVGPAPEDRAVLGPGELAHFQRDYEVVFR